MSPGHPLQPLLLYNSPLKGTKPHPGVCAFLCTGSALFSVLVCAMELPHVPTGLLLLLAGRRRDFWKSVPPELGGSAPHRRCCLRTSPEYIKHNFLLFHWELVNISLGHRGSLQSPCFKGGQLSAALGLAFGFASSRYYLFCGFKNRLKEKHPAEEKAWAKPTGLSVTCMLLWLEGLLSSTLPALAFGEKR